VLLKASSRQRLADPAKTNFCYFDPAFTMRALFGGQQHAAAILVVQQGVVTRWTMSKQGFE
jgi:hypothetical protein|tara:strand:+ start:926 stop:1108 length:183 start_codon:yes stop_codon:yes gene_type:complete